MCYLTYSLQTIIFGMNICYATKLVYNGLVFILTKEQTYEPVLKILLRTLLECISILDTLKYLQWLLSLSLIIRNYYKKHFHFIHMANVSSLVNKWPLFIHPSYNVERNLLLKDALNPDHNRISIHIPTQYWNTKTYLITL